MRVGCLRKVHRVTHLEMDAKIRTLVAALRHIHGAQRCDTYIVAQRCDAAGEAARRRRGGAGAAALLRLSRRAEAPGSGSAVALPIYNAEPAGFVRVLVLRRH